jgi:hypothetical protein
MEATCSSETLVDFQRTTRRYTPEDSKYSSSFKIACYLLTVSVLRQCSVDDRMINEYGADGGMRIGRGNRSTQRKPAPVHERKGTEGRNLQ